jgi:hypothetical protein
MPAAPRQAEEDARHACRREPPHGPRTSAAHTALPTSPMSMPLMRSP